MGLRRFFCKHNWEVVKQEKTALYREDGKVPVGYSYVIIQRCKKCGKVEKIEVKY